MSLSRIQKIASTTLVVLLSAAPLLVKAQQTSDSSEITELLSQAKAGAYRVALDAEKLESYTHARLDWKTHAYQLQQMRGHVNELGEDVGKLTALRPQGSAWQQEAIDQINPALQAMADHLTATIEHLNENQTRIHFQAYQDYARGNRVFADKTLAVIRDFADYSKARAEADALEQKLSLDTAQAHEPGL